MSYILGGLISLILFSSSESQNNCLRVRAGFDVGSGSTKMKVYKVDVCKNKVVKQIKKEICDHKEAITYDDDLDKNGVLSKSILKKGLSVLKKMKEVAISCGAQEFHGVATSSFRLASNGREAVKYLSTSGIDIEIISQKEEAEIGFNGAVDKGELDRENVCVWDIGGSSMQITCTKNGRKKYFLGLLASGKFKRELLILKKSKKLSPNPISKNIYHRSRRVTMLEGAAVKRKLNNLMKENSVIGIGGVHYYALSKSISKKEYNSSDLEIAILARLNKTDEELGGGSYADSSLSNIILVKGMIDTLQIKKVKALKVNLSEGLVVSPKYWK